MSVFSHNIYLLYINTSNFKNVIYKYFALTFYLFFKLQRLFFIVHLYKTFQYFIDLYLVNTLQI